MATKKKGKERQETNQGARCHRTTRRRGRKRRTVSKAAGNTR